MSTDPLTRDERGDPDDERMDVVRALRDGVAGYAKRLQSAEERAERAERVVAMFRYLDEVDESTTASEPLTGYVTAWDRVADLIERTGFAHVPPAEGGDA